MQLPLNGFCHNVTAIMQDANRSRSVLLSFRFVGTAVAGSVLMALVTVFAELPSQIALLGAFISILGGLFLSYLDQSEQREQERARAIESLSVPLSLSADKDLFKLYEDICRGLTSLSKQPDPILRDIALLKLASVVEQIDGLAAGRVVFSLTEAWRSVYEEILGSSDINEYRSVALVRSPRYWQDEPGRRSMQANYDAVDRGMLVKRIIILRDDLWPHGHSLPAIEVFPWIEEQHDHGLWIGLVRESEVSHEPDLLVDMGIYGNRAVGMQELDEHSRTLRFTLELSAQAPQVANEKWTRLMLYAKWFGNLLEQDPSPR